MSGPKGEGIELYVPNGQGPSATVACPFFASAAADGTCNPGGPVVGETVHVLSQEEVEYRDPPDVLGNGQLSGGRYADEGVVIWVPATQIAGFEGFGWAVQADCALPAADSSWCSAVLTFVSTWYAQPVTSFEGL